MRPVGGWVHSGSLGPFGHALGVVWFRWVQALAVVGFIRVR